MRKTQILMNEPFYLFLSILGLHLPKYGKNAKLCYMDTGSFIIHVKTDDIYNDIKGIVETRFGTSNFESDRP